jgi:amidohydrolase
MQQIESLRELLADQREDYLRFSREIWERPELGFEEHYACRRQVELLTASGFQVVTPYAGMDTAYRAEWGTGGEVFAIASEYDALPEIDHACGHNLICTAAMAAAELVRKTLERSGQPGRIVVLGTPGEESMGGKVIMLREKCLEGVGAVMMVHPGWRSSIDMGSSAVNRLNVEFFGKAAHAGGSPERGINALDAMIMLFNGISVWRQQLPESSRVHGIIEAGGERPNIIPDYTRCWFYLRSPENDQLEQMNERFLSIVEGAATMTGCTYKTIPNNLPYKARKPNAAMNRRYAEAMRVQGHDVKVEPVKAGRGSSDFGDFSQICPGIHPYFGISAIEISGHSKEFCAAASSALAGESMLAAAVAMADIALTYLSDADFRDEVQRDFKNAK